MLNVQVLASADGSHDSAISPTRVPSARTSVSELRIAHHPSTKWVSGDPLRGSRLSDVAPPATPNVTDPPRIGAARTGEPNVVAAATIVPASIVSTMNWR